MDIFQHSSLNKLSSQRIGRFAEYWVKLSLTLAGLDIYSTEVDDKGIDFVGKVNRDRYVDFQVKSIRTKTSYIYIKKETWKDGLHENLYLVLVVITEKGMPEIFLIPSIVWRTPNKIFVDRPYGKEGQKSKPEWGMNIPKKLELLSEFEFTKQVEKIGMKK